MQRVSLCKYTIETARSPTSSGRTCCSLWASQSAAAIALFSTWRCSVRRVRASRIWRATWYSATLLGRPVGGGGAIAGSLGAGSSPSSKTTTARALRHTTGATALGGSGIQAALSSRAVPAAPASAAAKRHSSARRSATDAASELSPDAQTVYLHCSPYARASCLQLFEVFVVASFMQMRHGRSEMPTVSQCPRKSSRTRTADQTAALRVCSKFCAAQAAWVDAESAHCVCVRLCAVRLAAARTRPC